MCDMQKEQELANEEEDLRVYFLLGICYFDLIYLRECLSALEPPRALTHLKKKHHFFLFIYKYVKQI